MKLEEYLEKVKPYYGKNKDYDGINPVLKSLSLEKVEQLEKDLNSQTDEFWEKYDWLF